jgi:DDE superfamily endonuclease
MPFIVFKSSVYILGGVLMYLPPYLPDYNPIEQSFSSLKGWLQRNYIPDINKDVPLTFLHLACDSITAKKAQGWYQGAGYMWSHPEINR